MNNLVQRLRDNADIDEAEGCTASVVALEREAADSIAQLEQRNSCLHAARIAYANEFPLNSEGEPDVGSIHQNIRKLKSDYAQLETDLASAKTAMQEISKLHDHEMSGNEIRMNAYDMACIARQFLHDAAIKEQQ